MPLRRTLIAAAALAFTALAGCTGPSPPPPAVLGPVIQVLGPNDVVAAGALIAFQAADNKTLLVANADGDGAFARALVPAGAASYSIRSAVGSGAGGITAPGLPDTVRLEALPEVVLGLPGTLAFRAPVDLLCTTPDQAPQADCGQFGEPVMEVAGDGTIWASATCCVYKAPPIWRSHDGGKTFAQMRNTDTGLTRDAYGIEGDLAIDDAGNVYFFDIAVATIWFTSYTSDGTHRWTTPWPVDPHVDRPWVRAGAENEVFIAFNTGGSTDFYASTDGGRTWGGTVAPPATFPCPLGNLGQGAKRSDLYIVAPCNGSDSLMLWSSHDSGKTWDAGKKVPMPAVPYKKGARGLEVMNPPVGDESGNVYVPFTHFVDAKNTQNAVFVARLAPDGTWAFPVQISEPGLVHLPWGAAGRDGHVSFAWYQADGTFAKETAAKWHLMAAASVDASAAEPHYQRTVADGSVLLEGTFGRNLGDFIETDLTPDGRTVVVYAKSEGGSLTNRFVSSDGWLPLGRETFLNGPHAA